MRTAAFLLLVAVFGCVSTANAGRPGGQVVIDGVDSVCSGFTPSTSGGSSVYTCIPSGVSPGAPTNCVATVNGGSTVNFASTGGSASLAVTCTQTTGVSYNWRRNGTTGVSTLASWSDTLAANATGSAINYSYQVNACIGANCVLVPTAALVATVAATGSFSGTCPGFDNTIVLAMNWGSPVRLYTGHMGANDIVLVTFTTGNTSTTNSLGRVAGAEYNSPPSGRIATLSANPCDFTTQAAPGANMQGNSITASFAITPGSGFGYYPVLSKNHLYYLNIKNSPNSTCVNAAVPECGMFFDLLNSGL